jgi:hypothetical protein
VSKLSKGVISGVTCGGKHGGLNAMPHRWRQQETASQNRLSQRRTVVSAVDPDKLGIVRTEGTTMALATGSASVRVVTVLNLKVR